MADVFSPLKNLPGCMMPDGGECCAGYLALFEDWNKLREAMKGAAVIANNSGSLLKAQDSKIDALVKSLTRARDAIASLSMESLGYASAENDQAHWPIRDELLHNIDQALAGAA